MHLGELAQVGVVLDLLLQRLAAPDCELPPLSVLVVSSPILLHVDNIPNDRDPGCIPQSPGCFI